MVDELFEAAIVNHIELPKLSRVDVSVTYHTIDASDLATVLPTPPPSAVHAMRAFMEITNEAPAWLHDESHLGRASHAH